ncbi:hypothetical protein OfM1_18860 [Lactovum odontotermitis]
MAFDMSFDLGGEIVNALKEYTDDVEQELEKVFDETEKETLSKLKEETASAGFKKRKNRTAKGWKVQKEGRKRTFYNTDAKTHLLNNGHATRNGGRTKAYHFVEPVEEWLAEELPARVEKVLGGS